MNAHGNSVVASRVYHFLFACNLPSELKRVVVSQLILARGLMRIENKPILYTVCRPH